MNLFKPRRTFESVVCELVAGLEEGTIVLKKEPDAPISKHRAIEVDLSAGLVGVRVTRTLHAKGKSRRLGYINECVLETTGSRKNLVIDTAPVRAVRAAHQSS